jgi:hypothetical protein
MREYLDVLREAPPMPRQVPGQPPPDTSTAASQQMPASRPLTGVIDVHGLAKLLPGLTDMTQFVNAMTKVRTGKTNTLTIAERMQLALAFIALVGDPSETKYAALRKLMPMQAPPSQ